MFATDYGFFGLTGVSVQKISDDLDGFFQGIFFGSNNSGFGPPPIISAGKCVINSVLCVCFLVQYSGAIANGNYISPRPIICVLMKDKWFFSSYNQAGTNGDPDYQFQFIAQGSPDPDVPSLWAMAARGKTLYKLFNDKSVVTNQTLQTKLWDMGDSLVTKQALKCSIEGSIGYSTINQSLNISIETGDFSQASLIYNTLNTVTFLNNTLTPISIINNLSQTIVWIVSGYSMNQFNVEGIGNYLGLTLTTNIPGNTFNGLHLQYEPRTSWTSRPF
jgi:hypothetical protein